MSPALTRRRFLQQTLAFAALARPDAFALSRITNLDASANHVLMLGDWGWEDLLQGQSQVAGAMAKSVRDHSIKPDALLMLGDSWYGDLDGGADSPRWERQFEQLYAEDAFSSPVYSIAGNHDYQKSPHSAT